MIDFSRQGWPYAGLVAAMFLWATSFVVMKFAFAHTDPMVVIFGRLAVAAVVFTLVHQPFRRVSVAPGDWKWLLWMAFCEPCLYFLLEVGALQNTSASQAGMITAMLPLLVSLAAWAILKESINRYMLIGFIVAMLGACWLSVAAHPNEAAPRPVLGNLLEFLAMVCATGYIITLKRLTVRYSPVFLTGVQAMVGALFYLPTLFLPSIDLAGSLTIEAFFVIIYLGTAVTLGAYGLYNYGISRIPASQATAFVNLIPVFTVTLGWSLLGERLTVAQLFACGLILGGVLLSQKSTAPSVSLPH